MAENLITSQVHKIFTLKALLPLLTFAGGGSSILSGELLSSVMNFTSANLTQGLAWFCI